MFTGAGVRKGPQLGGLGGGVNFTTLQPTLSWESYDSLMLPVACAQQLAKLAETGSFGKLGVALDLCGGLATSWLDGLRYTDASGLNYVHDGDANSFGSSGRLRYEFEDSQTITGTFLTFESHHERRLRANTIRRHPLRLRPEQLFGRKRESVLAQRRCYCLARPRSKRSIYQTNSTSLDDELDRYIDGVAVADRLLGAKRSPGFYAQRYPSGGAATHDLAYRLRLVGHVAAHFRSTNRRRRTTRTCSIAAMPPSEVTDSIHSNEHLTLSESLGVTQGTGGFGGVLERWGRRGTRRKYDTLPASYTVQGSPAQQTRSTILTDPAALRYTCDGANSVAYGNAPGAAPEASSSTSTRLGYTHTFNGGNLSLQLYRQLQKNVLLPTDVNGTVLAGKRHVHAFIHCSSATDLSKSPRVAGAYAVQREQLYFSTPVAGVDRVYQGDPITGYGRSVISSFSRSGIPPCRKRSRIRH